MMFIINCHYQKNDDDTMGAMFPLNTYHAMTTEQVVECIAGLLNNRNSGINKVVLFNTEMDDSPLSGASVGQAPMPLWEERVDEKKRKETPQQCAERIGDIVNDYVGDRWCLLLELDEMNKNIWQQMRDDIALDNQEMEDHCGE